MREDFGLATDLAAKHPEKVEAMKALFIEEARKNNVFPIDDRREERRAPYIWCSTSTTMAAACTRARRVPSLSTVRRSRRAASRRPWEDSTPWPLRPRTSAATPIRQ